MSEIEYVLMDPSKNITILVETFVEVEKQKKVAKELLKKEPKAEQVGFIMSFDENDISIRMAGGEFCGNAAMSVAAYYAIKNKIFDLERKVSFYGNDGNIKNEVRVKVHKKSNGKYEGTVYMPQPKSVKEIKLPNYKTLPVVAFDGISHIIVDDAAEKKEFEKYIKEWCEYLNVEAVGIVFGKELQEEKYEIKPLVYVKDVDSLYWENACASGTFAYGTYKMLNNNRLQHIYIKQPGGDTMEVQKSESEPLCLIGTVALM